ncbi:MAG: hypothetical protein NT027_11230 [Proteobacteria bacterium]|nr:hypothetical protein [Pseudomonadota bacterium]
MLSESPIHTQTDQFSNGAVRLTPFDIINGVSRTAPIFNSGVSRTAPILVVRHRYSVQLNNWTNTQCHVKSKSIE